MHGTHGMGTRRPYADFEEVERTDRHIKRGTARAVAECNVKKKPGVTRFVSGGLSELLRRAGARGCLRNALGRALAGTSVPPDDHRGCLFCCFPLRLTEFPVASRRLRHRLTGLSFAVFPRNNAERVASRNALSVDQHYECAYQNLPSRIGDAHTLVQRGGRPT